jgi:predicted dehydrogenase
MAKKRPIKVGIVGLGRAGWGMHCGELDKRADKFTIVAGCDVERSRCRRLEERYPDCRTYLDIADLIADPEVELVDIASRSPEHVPHTLLALRAGKTVFLEKPIALTYREALRLKRAVATASADLYIRHNRRFEPAFQHIRELLATGILGDVYQIKLHRHGYQRRDDWQTLMRCGGGQLLNWGPHIIDHALRFLESPVVDVWSHLNKIAAVGDAEDHLKILLKGRNGRLVDLEISGGTALGQPAYVIFGTRGALISDEKDIQLRYLDPKQELLPRRARSSSLAVEGFGSAEELRWVEKTVPVKPKLKCDMDSIWDYLYDAIRRGKPFPITLDEALAVMRVVSAVKEGTRFDRED